MIPLSRDFSQGKISKLVLAQAVPMTVAQLVQLLYNIVDRIYLGHLPSTDSLALTGVGLVFPLTTMIAAFTCLVSYGALPLFSIARGAKDQEEADAVLGNALSLLLGISAGLMLLGYCLKRPILFLFGASDASFPYADAYLRIYLLGTFFSVLTTGMNGFINAQGFPKVGMLTTVLGALLNLALDPLFIFGMKMGVSGAALATILSQAVSCLWVLRFLTRPELEHRIRLEKLQISLKRTKKIVELGLAGFIMQVTNALVTICCNANLSRFGGDLYVGVMTVLSSVRELLYLPCAGLTNGVQPVLGYNYGAKEFGRVKQAIRFMASLGIGITATSWLLCLVLANPIVAAFTNDHELLLIGPSALKIYFFGYVFMALQFTGQSVFQALGYAKRAIFFSMLRKVFIVVPLIYLLPLTGMGVNGVFWSEPISNVLGGSACCATMILTVYRKLAPAASVDKKNS